MILKIILIFLLVFFLNNFNFQCWCLLKLIVIFNVSVDYFENKLNL
jgi:hypothetical protein